MREYFKNTMINAAVSHITSCLNQYLKNTFDLNENIVETANLLDQDGSVATNVSDKLVVSLVNIEKDKTFNNFVTSSPTSTKNAITRYPPLNLNFYLMFAAHFSSKNYDEALKFLSHTISFFQKNPVFNRQNTPDLDSCIEKLLLDIENLSIRDLSSLWSILSGKYLPSVLYKVRMVTFNSDDIVARVPISTDLETSVAN